jgi:hypothetical protein
VAAGACAGDYDACTQDTDCCSGSCVLNGTCVDCPPAPLYVCSPLGPDNDGGIPSSSGSSNGGIDLPTGG